MCVEISTLSAIRDSGSISGAALHVRITFKRGFTAEEWRAVSLAQRCLGSMLCGYLVGYNTGVAQTAAYLAIGVVLLTALFYPNSEWHACAAAAVQATLQWFHLLWVWAEVLG